jgi:hypothetical protein
MEKEGPTDSHGTRLLRGRVDGGGVLRSFVALRRVQAKMNITMTFSPMAAKDMKMMLVMTMGACAGLGGRYSQYVLRTGKVWAM